MEDKITVSESTVTLDEMFGDNEDAKNEFINLESARKLLTDGKYRALLVTGEFALGDIRNTNEWAKITTNRHLMTKVNDCYNRCRCEIHDAIYDEMLNVIRKKGNGLLE